MSKKAENLSNELCEKLAHAKGIITVCQGASGVDELFGFALQAAINLIDQADRAAVRLAQLAGANP